MTYPIRPIPSSFPNLSVPARNVSDMYEGALILESLKVGTELAGVPLVVRKISRYGVSGAGVDQPEVWSVLEFGVEDGDAEGLAEVLAGVLDQPGWYADFHDEREI